MNNPSETSPTAADGHNEPTLSTIIRGEDVLDEVREVAQRISTRVSRAVTERAHPDGPRPDRQCAAPPAANPRL